MRTVLVFAASLVAVASLLPLFETDVWWVRVLDFPRLHYVIGLVVIGAVYALIGGLRHAVGWAALGLMMLAAGYNVFKIHAYAPLVPEMAIATQACPEGSRLRVLIANVRLGNRHATALLELVGRHEPDLFFAMETDEWWDERLDALRPEFAYRVEHFDEAGSDHFGLHLFSKYPLVVPEVRFLTGKDAPAVFTGVRLPDGERIEFYGIHPRPPTMGQASTWRDAQILAAAMEARSAAKPVVVAGDLNAVPWERVVRRALRVGGLLDPRVGRGYVASYDAQQPWLWWPLDQVLFQDQFALLGLERLSAFGSDHYPILADLCHLRDAAERQAAPALNQGDLAEVRQTLEAGLRAEALPLALRRD